MKKNLNCHLSNFTVEEFGNMFANSQIAGEDLGAIILQVESVLINTKAFSTDSELSKDPDKYKSSVTALTQFIYKQIEEELKPSFLQDAEGNFRKLTESERTRVRQSIKAIMFSKEETPLELHIKQVIEGVLIPSESDRRSLDLGEAINDLYETSDVINLARQSEFVLDISKRTIIDLSRNILVDSDADVNSGIQAYQEEQYQIIRNYLLSLKIFDESFIADKLYYSYAKDGAGAAKRKNTEKYTNAMRMMYVYILKLKAEDKLGDQLETEWINKRLAKGTHSLYDAVNAYINLVYFDDVLHESFEGAFSVNSNQSMPIIDVLDGNLKKKQYKYSLSRGNSNAVNTWGKGDSRNAIEEMSKVLKVYIQFIPRYSYSTKQLLYGNLDPKDFIGTFAKLLDAIPRLVGEKTLKDIYYKFRKDPINSVEQLLKEIFKRNNITLINSLKELGLDSNFIDVLYSVYRELFANEHSWKKASDNYYKLRGIHPLYNALETLFGVMISNTAMNYLQTRYDYDSKTFKTEIKSRFTINRSKFDIVHHVNKTTIDSENKQAIVNAYPLSKTSDFRLYWLALGNFIIPITVASNSDLLYKDVLDSKADVSDLNQFNTLISNLDLNTRSRLTDSEATLNETEKNFMQILKFIDTMLSTNFSVDEDGLFEFKAFVEMHSNNFKEIFLSAVRALRVMLIYQEFSKAKKEDGSPYAKNELKTFLKENTGIHDVQLGNVTGDDIRKYFIDREDGKQLTTVQAGQRWITDLATTRTILSGDTFRSVISNMEGSKIPNTSPTFLGNTLVQQLYDSKLHEGTAGSFLLFASNPEAIKSAVVNTDVATSLGTSKSIKNMTPAELMYDAIVNKFVLPYLDDKSVYIQPTVYSDKTKFISYLVSLKDLGIDDFNASGFESNIENGIIKTIGNAYSEVKNKILLDYANWFPQFCDASGKLNIRALENWMKTPLTKEEKAIYGTKERHLQAIVNAYNKLNEANEPTYKERYLYDNKEDLSKEAWEALGSKEQQRISEKVSAWDNRSGSLNREIHYRIIEGGALSLNELLFEYTDNIYKNTATLHKRLAEEKIKFANDLLKNLVHFTVKLNGTDTIDKSAGGLSELVVLMLGSNGKGSDEVGWLVGNELAIGRIYNSVTKEYKLVTHGKIELQPNESFQLNPILNAFFMVDNYVGNNLRYSLNGAELNHKCKALAKLKVGNEIVKRLPIVHNQPVGDLNTVREVLSNVVSDFLGVITLSDLKLFTNRVLEISSKKNLEEQIKKLDEEMKRTTKSDDPFAIGAYDELSILKELLENTLRLKQYISNNKDIVNAIEDTYKEWAYKLENLAQNALFKRNVIIPGTIRPYLQGTINGIRNKMNIAVIDDVQAQVFNFIGLRKGIDAHDGAAFIDPFTSMLENYSLQDCEVGTVKKPIHHFYDNSLMTGGLLKYAVDTITNLWMRQSEGNQLGDNKSINLYKVFKKMTHVRWHRPDGTERFGPIDLINGCEYRKVSNINFNLHILRGKNLYYLTGARSYNQIKDFKLEDGRVYYTVESKVSNTGGIIGEDYKLYHYYTENGDHVPSTTLLSEEEMQQQGLHTIDSLFELHAALGGIYSLSINSDGILQYSEASNEAVVAFMNNVAIDMNAEEITSCETNSQSRYYQPLKYAVINMIANNSSFKNGVGNINPSTSFYDDTELSYIEVSTNDYGVQMDSDHDADEAQMTEFSQVISSLDAGGRLHDYVSEIYQTLGKLTIEMAQIEIDSVNEYRETGNKTGIYEVVGRTMINNLSRNKGLAGLALAIVKAIKTKLNINTDHKYDPDKLPFSDSSIYATILSTFVSQINKKSVKRQYPGLGTVMVPGYDLSTIYEIDGVKYLYLDLILLANELSILSTHLDTAARNKDIVSLLLRAKLNAIYSTKGTYAVDGYYDNVETFIPTDLVDAFVQLADGSYAGTTIDLDDPSVYYAFKLGYIPKDAWERLNVRRFGHALWDLTAVDDLVELLEVDKPWKDDEIALAKGEITPDEVRYNKTVRIYLRGQQDKGYFELVKDDENNNYSVHFKTKTSESDYGDPGIIPSTKEERQILWRNLYALIPSGANVSTHGKLTPNGEWAINHTIANARDVNGLLLFTLIDERAAKRQGTNEDITLGVFLKKGLRYSKCVTSPRNLAPAKIFWEYEGDDGQIHYMNIFDHHLVKLAFRSKGNKEVILQVFDELERGIYTDELGRLHKVYSWEKNSSGKWIRVNKTLNIAAEVIMSNIFKTIFGLKDSDSLNTILRKGESYFLERKVTYVESDNYDLVFTKHDGKHTYITFNELPEITDSFDAQVKPWILAKKDFHYPKNYTGPRIIRSKVMATTKDNLPLFEVGREIYRNDLKGEVVRGKVRAYKIVKNEDGTEEKKYVDGDFKLLGDDNKVIEYVQFITRYKVTENNGTEQTYTSLNIDKKALRRVILLEEITDEKIKQESEKRGKPVTREQLRDEELHNRIGKILAAIYKASDYSVVLINRSLSSNSHYTVKFSLSSFSELLTYDNDLCEFIKKDLQAILKTGKTDAEGRVTYSNRAANNALAKYKKLLAKKLWSSFLKSLEFTASRIPAQTLQSFMKMQNVGFTGVKTAQCFVSHWQAWLQGSDYRYSLIFTLRAKN